MIKRKKQKKANQSKGLKVEGSVANPEMLLGMRNKVKLSNKTPTIANNLPLGKLCLSLLRLKTLALSSK